MLVLTKAVFCWAAMWAFRSAMHAPGGLAALQPLTLAARTLICHNGPVRSSAKRPSLANAYGSRSTSSVVLSQCSDVSTATGQLLLWPELQQWGCGFRQRKKITRRHTGAATQAIDTRTRVAHTLVIYWLGTFEVFLCDLFLYILFIHLIHFLTLY
jgi:hypothetical protein